MTLYYCKVCGGGFERIDTCKGCETPMCLACEDNHEPGDCREIQQDTFDAERAARRGGRNDRGR
jgi:hypothetical protein